MPRPACPKCGEKHCSRRKREGIVQILVWPRLGWYPWQCGACRHVFIVKFRGKSKRNRPGDDAVSTLPPNQHLTTSFLQNRREQELRDEEFEDFED